MKLENVDSKGTVGFEKATVIVADGSPDFILTGTGTTTAEIGSISNVDFVYGKDWGIEQKSTYEQIKTIGEKEITEISMERDQITYRVEISSPVTIRQNNFAPPSVTFLTAAGYEGFEDPSVYNKESEDGGSFYAVLPQSIGVVKMKHTVTDDSVPYVERTDLSTEEKLMWLEMPAPNIDYKQINLGFTKFKKYIVTQEFTYHLYSRKTTVYEKTSTSQLFQAEYGLIGWKTGDTVYLPGETILITGAMRLEPVIGVIGKDIAIEQPVVKTTRKFVRQETSLGTKSTSVTVESERFFASSGENEEIKQKAIKDAAGQYQSQSVLKAAGLLDSANKNIYTWFDANQPGNYVEWGYPEVEEKVVE